VRFDFLAYSNGSRDMRLHTLNYNSEDVLRGLYGQAKTGGWLQNAFSKPVGSQYKSGNFFTSDLELFRNRLESIEISGDEASAYALDLCADFPFRDAAKCHRVVIFMTDETIDEGVDSAKAKNRIMDLAKKYQDKKIALYMITPECDVFDTLSQIDKCEWTIDTSRGLTAIDFTKTLQSIGKSVSVSQTSAAGLNEAKPLFGEDRWTKLSGDYVAVNG